MNLEMAAGDASLDELIGSVTRGVYVTRFHYVNVEDPITVMLTGMTRDGTFMIENGRLTRPLKNLRFTQSAVEALAHCEGVTRERRFVGNRGGRGLHAGPAARQVRVHGADRVGPHPGSAPSRRAAQQCARGARRGRQLKTSTSPGDLLTPGLVCLGNRHRRGGASIGGRLAPEAGAVRTTPTQDVSVVQARRLIPLAALTSA